MQMVPLVNVSPISQYYWLDKDRGQLCFLRINLLIFLAINYTGVTCVRYKSIALQESNKAFFISLFAYSQKICSQFRSSPSKVFLEKGVLKIYSKFTGEHSCWDAISIKLLCNFIEIALWYGCSPVNSLYIFRTPFPKNISGWLLLLIVTESSVNDRELWQLIRPWCH